MKITALDIHQKEFARGMRGYREDEVDGFLDQLAVEIDSAAKQIQTLEEKVAALESQGANLEAERNTINHTLLTAQKAADDMLEKARVQSEEMLVEARKQHASELEKLRQESESYAAEARQKHHKLVGSLARLQEEEEQFRRRYVAQLDSFLRDVRRIESQARTAVKAVPMSQEAEKELQAAKRDEAAPGQQPVQQAPAAVAPQDAPDPMAAALDDTDFFEIPPVSIPAAGEGEPTPAPAPAEAPAQKQEAPAAEQWGDMDNDDLDIEEID
ncbi:MAG: DivIVA domain-containing protein [Actinomycetia bacterium]|nr:DivIVA domain-containing protein [Actinomycetes bacterium]